jgi:hypothetical protein
LGITTNLEFDEYRSEGDLRLKPATAQFLGPLTA